MNFNTKLTCPRCGCASPMRAFSSAEMTEIAALAARFGSRWPWVSEYLHGFQADHDKPLRPSKLMLLIEEVSIMVERKGFPYDGKDYAIRPEALYQALREVALKNMTGLRNHNYLKKVAIGVNQKMIEKEETEQRARAHEAQHRRDAYVTAPEKIKKMIEGIGGKDRDMGR